MFLAMTGLTEFWDVHDEVLLLHRGCLRYDRRDSWRHARWQVAPNPWEDVRVLEQAKVYCGEVYECMLEQASGLLNRIHGLNEPTSYWRVIVGPWLLHHVHVTYERYCALRSVAGDQPTLHTRILPEGMRITPIDTRHFLRLATSSDFFNWQLYSHLLRALKLPNLVMEETVLTPDTLRAVELQRHDIPRGSRARALVRKAVLGVTPSLYGVVAPRVLLGQIDMGAVDRLRLLLRLRSFHAATTVLLNRSSSDGVVRDEHVRHAFDGLVSRDDFMAVLISTLGEYFPYVHLEGFARARARVKGIWARPPAVLVSSDWYNDESFKIVAAESRKGGSWLIGLQHGGGYGTYRVLPQEDLETAIVDRWLSYGWRPVGPGVIQPLAHPRFRSPRRRIFARRRPRTILFVTTTYARYPSRMQSRECPLGRLLDWRDRFAQRLAPALHSRLLFAFAGPDLVWGQRERLIELGVPLRVKTIGYRPFLAAARIAVVEYNGTSALEILSANIPTVLFWNSHNEGLRADAKPYYDQLRVAGILLDTPEEAAERVSELYDDPLSWWQQEHVQGARQAFVDRHARADTNWLAEWARVLSGAVRDGERRQAMMADLPGDLSDR